MRRGPGSTTPFAFEGHGYWSRPALIHALSNSFPFLSWNKCLSILRKWDRPTAGAEKDSYYI